MRSILVLLNGPPASGKSTLARRWCEEHASGLPLALDLDVLRGMLGGWREARLDAGLATRAMALAAVEVHLAAGRDVLVPQYLERAAFIDDLAAAAARSGAAFLECALRVHPQLGLARHRARELAAVARGAGAEEGELDEPLEALQERFAAFLTGRPDAAVLDPDAPDVLVRLDELIARARRRPQAG